MFYSLQQTQGKIRPATVKLIHNDGQWEFLFFANFGSKLLQTFFEFLERIFFHTIVFYFLFDKIRTDFRNSRRNFGSNFFQFIQVCCINCI